MSLSLRQLLDELNSLLQPAEFQDYCPNGLQVEGRPEVGRLVTGVTASRELLEAAIDAGADAVLVHHGYFWRGEDPTVTGIKKERLRLLLEHDISLIAYHLPLDAHPTLGNNASLAALLGFEIEDQLDRRHRSRVGLRGRLAEPLSGEALAAHLSRLLGRQALHIPGRADPIRSIGWCTGAAQNSIELAQRHGLDAYLSGEISEQTVHFARESGIHYFAAGHHATERYGVQAVGRHLADKLGLEHLFIDIDNPV